MNYLHIIENYIEAYNSFDIEAMMTTLHPDIEFKNIANGEINASTSGKEAFRNLAEQSKSLFSSRKQTIVNYEIKDEQASIDIEFEAVLATDLPNGLKAGETLKLKGRSEFTFSCEKILSITDIA